MFEPIPDFLVDPFGGGGFRRGEQQEMARLPKRLLDRRPQMRRCRQAGVIAEEAQRPALIPWLAELLDRRLQRRRDRLVVGVAVRDEGVVERHGATPCSARLL